MKFGERADMIAYNPTIDDLHNCLKRNVRNYYLKFARNLFNYSKAYMVFRHISIIYIINIIIIMEWWLKQMTKEGKQFRWIFVSVRIENSNCNLFGATFDEWRVRANIFGVFAIRLFVMDNVGFFFLSLSLPSLNRNVKFTLHSFRWNSTCSQCSIVFSFTHNWPRFKCTVNCTHALSLSLIASKWRHSKYLHFIIDHIS